MDIGVLIEGRTTTPVTLSGIDVRNASQGMVSGNDIFNCSQWGIVEASPSNNNVFIGNRLIGNTSGGLSMSGPDSRRG